MNGLIRFSLSNWYAVVVLVLTIAVLGVLTARVIPIDILPAFNSPAVQVLTFYGGMPAANVENDITNRMERWTGQAAGTARQESRSIVGASIVRNYYRDDIDPNGALTQVNSLASAAIPNLPPGTLPPVILPFDPTGTTPVCLVALDWANPPSNYTESNVESILYDTGRYEVRNMIMGVRGSVAPVVYGGRLRVVLAYVDPIRTQARNLSPLDLMRAIDRNNIFLPTGAAKFGTTDYALDSNSMYEFVDHMGDIPVRSENGRTIFLRDVADPQDASLIQTNVVRVSGRRQVYIPVYRQQGSSTLDVVDGLKQAVPEMKSKLNHDDIDLKVVMDQSVYVSHSIASLIEEGVLGAILCSLVILFFLGEWRMTLIAILTIPISVLSALIWLYYTGNTINVMTLAGLSLAIGPLVDTRDHLPGEYPPPPGAGCQLEGGGILRRQRSGHARVGCQLLHTAGACPTGPDAGYGSVLVPSHGAGRCLRHDLGLPAIAIIRSRDVFALAACTRPTARTCITAKTTSTAARTNSTNRAGG